MSTFTIIKNSIQEVYIKMSNIVLLVMILFNAIFTINSIKKRIHMISALDKIILFLLIIIQLNSKNINEPDNDSNDSNSILEEKRKLLNVLKAKTNIKIPIVVKFI